MVVANKKSFLGGKTMDSMKLVLQIVFVLLVANSAVFGSVFTDEDSTQPRGAPTGEVNSQGQSLDPVSEGFMSPAFRGQQSPAILQIYKDWSGMPMANSSRDPGFLATLMVANRDFINYANSISGNPSNEKSRIHEFLKSLELEKDVTTRDKNRKLQPENDLPMIADFCLRCHAPVGWLEAKCQPATSYESFLKGQFWSAAAVPFPGFPGAPRLVDLSKESESEGDGVECDFCHRANDNFKRQSNFDGSLIPNGNGVYFVDLTNIFGTGHVFPAHNFQRTPEFCGTCHDLTNPLLETMTVVNGHVPQMLHPLERTFTEWKWSDYGATNFRCQNCHVPMKFQGAQSWLLYPGLNTLVGAVDTIFTNPPYDYQVPPDRNESYQAALTRNRDFMKTAASVSFVGPPSTVKPGQTITAQVQVINNAGHKLPTGYGEGRQIWIHIQAVDAMGNVFFEDGLLDPTTGRLVRNRHVTKVYEIRMRSIGYRANVVHSGDREHFFLNNFTEKDNRIPPAGFNKDAYTADGAFILPHDPKDTDYVSGQNWDITPYHIRIPARAVSPISITATLKYQTFSQEYVEFLETHDTELTQAHGGRARNIPAGPYGSLQTWGEVTKQIWIDTGNGPAVDIGSATILIDVQ
jgi:hypothetical protein